MIEFKDIPGQLKDTLRLNGIMENVSIGGAVNPRRDILTLTYSLRAMYDKITELEKSIGSLRKDISTIIKSMVAESKNDSV